MIMTDLETIIDGDGHLVEDLQGIADRMPSEIRRKYLGTTGTTLTRLFPPLDHFHSANPIETPPNSFAQVGYDGWLDFAEDLGIDSAVLYPTAALSYGKVVSRDWAIALAAAYNDWLYDTYMNGKRRFLGMGLIPMQEPEEAIKELRRCVEELGMPGAMLPSAGFKDQLGAKDFWPVYAEADRLGCALGVHGGAHEGFGFDHMNVYAPVHALGHPFGQMVGFAGIVFNGVMDKYPNVKWGFLEGGISWFLLCLERFDRSYETHIQYDPRNELIQLRPGERVSDYIKRHVADGRIYVGCEGTEPFVADAVKAAGGGLLFFSSDFPHEVNNEICKHEIQEILEADDITDSDKEGILHRNSINFYRIKNGA